MDQSIELNTRYYGMQRDMPEISCKTCRFWAETEEESNWSLCLLTQANAHETLTESVIFVVEQSPVEEEELWVELQGPSNLTSILNTRDDYGCVQYENKEVS